MLKIKFILFVILFHFIMISNVICISIGSQGSPFFRLTSNNAALRAKTIANSFYQVHGNEGYVVNDVNAFTGLPKTKVDLDKIVLNEHFELPVNLKYDEIIEGSVKTNNYNSPTGFLGIGWSISSEIYVARNLKGTISGYDDVYYAKGPFGSGQLLQNVNGRFYLVTNPYLQIDQITNSSGEITGWVITDPSNGIKFIFGSHADNSISGFVSKSTRYLKASSTTGLVSLINADMNIAYRWDLGVVEDNPGKNKILFEYSPQLESAGTSTEYTRGSLLKFIKIPDSHENFIKTYEFEYGNLDSKFYVDYGAQESKINQRLFEKKFLDQIKISFEDNSQPSKIFRFEYNNIEEGQNPIGAKRLLDEIVISYNYLGSEVTNDKWNFEYDESNNWLLKSLTSPENQKKTFEYKLGPAVPQLSERTMQFNGTDIEIKESTLVPGAEFPPRPEAHCNEQFCFITLSAEIEGRLGRSLAIEVYENRGNHFESDPIYQNIYTVDHRYTLPGGGFKKDFPRFIEIKDGFIVHSFKTKEIFVHTWNGKSWNVFSPNTENRCGHSQNNEYCRLTVNVGNDFFVVSDKRYDAGTFVEVFVRDGNHADGWRSMHSSNYNFGVGPGNYYDIYVSTSSNLIGFALKRVSEFVERGPGYDEFVIYKLNNDKTGLVEIYSEDNLTRIMVPIVLQDNYWVVKTTYRYASGLNQMSKIAAYTIDGEFLELYLRDWDDENPSTNYPSIDVLIRSHPNYFLIIDHYLKEVKLYHLNNTGFGVYNINYDPDEDNLIDIQVKMNEHSFFIGKVNDGTLDNRELWFQYRNRRPHPQMRDAELYRINSRNTIFSIDKIYPLPQDWFDVVYSTTDDLMIGATLTDVYAYNINPWISAGNYIHNPGVDPLFFSNGWSFSGYNSFSFANRIFATTSVVGNNVKLNLLKSSAFGYDDNFQKPIIDKVVYKSGIEADPDIEYSFTPQGDFQFNHNNLTYQFQTMNVARPGIGSMTYNFKLDNPSEPLKLEDNVLNGKLISVTEKNAIAEQISKNTWLYDVYERLSNPDPWPQYLSSLRLSSTTNVKSSTFGGNQSTTMEYFQYNDITGIPYFTKSLLDGSWVVSQSILNENFLPSEYYVYNLKAEPTDLNDADISSPYNVSSVISSSKQTYDDTFKYKINENFQWNALPQLSRAELKTGVSPEYGISPDDYILELKINHRNELGEPREVIQYDNDISGFRNTIIYEGVDQRPVANFGNCNLVNCVALLGENITSQNQGIPGLVTLDHAKRWENAGAFPHNEITHTGRGAFVVDDSYGPTINIFLKNVPSKKFDLIVSAWIWKVDENSHPIIGIDRRVNIDNDTTKLDPPLPTGTASGYPVDGYEKIGVWQRWEAILPYEDIILNGLFSNDDNASDYIRVFVGSPLDVPAGLRGGKVYVDDIVIRPSTSVFSLETYNEKGEIESQTDTYHNTQYFKRDYMGRVTSIKDENFKIFSHSSHHKLGENE